MTLNSKLCLHCLHWLKLNLNSPTNHCKDLIFVSSVAVKSTQLGLNLQPHQLKAKFKMRQQNYISSSSCLNLLNRKEWQIQCRDFTLNVVLFSMCFDSFQVCPSCANIHFKMCLRWPKEPRGERCVQSQSGCWNLYRIWHLINLGSSLEYSLKL